MTAQKHFSLDLTDFMFKDREEINISLSVLSSSGFFGLGEHHVSPRATGELGLEANLQPT